MTCTKDVSAKAWRGFTAILFATIIAGSDAATATLTSMLVGLPNSIRAARPDQLEHRIGVNVVTLTLDTAGPQRMTSCNNFTEEAHASIMKAQQQCHAKFEQTVSGLSNETAELLENARDSNSGRSNGTALRRAVSLMKVLKRVGCGIVSCTFATAREHKPDCARGEDMANYISTDLKPREELLAFQASGLRALEVMLDGPHVNGSNRWDNTKARKDAVVTGESAKVLREALATMPTCFALSHKQTNDRVAAVATKSVEGVAIASFLEDVAAEVLRPPTTPFWSYNEAMLYWVTGLAAILLICACFCAMYCGQSSDGPNAF